MSYLVEQPPYCDLLRLSLSTRRFVRFGRTPLRFLSLGRLRTRCYTLSALLAFSYEGRGSFFLCSLREKFGQVRRGGSPPLHPGWLVMRAQAAYGGSIPPTDTCLGSRGSLLQSKSLAGAKGKVSPCPHVAWALGGGEGREAPSAGLWEYQGRRPDEQGTAAK